MKTDQNLMPFETALETIARLTQEKHSAEAEAARLRGLLANVRDFMTVFVPMQHDVFAEIRAAPAAGPLSAGDGEG